MAVLEETMSTLTIPKTLQVLRSEHEALAAMLRSLRMIVSRDGVPGGAPDFTLLRSMLFYIDEFPERRHHPKESELLFPRLRQRGARIDAVLDRLDAEHDHGLRRVRELEHALTAYEMLGEPRREAFVAAAERYVEGYLAHMAVEEREVFPVAAAVLTDEDWRALDAAFEADRDPLVGHMVANEYERLFSRIVRTAPAPIGLGEAR